MQIYIGERCQVFEGEEGGRLEVHYAGASNPQGARLVAANEFGEPLVAILDREETFQMREHIGALLLDGATGRCKSLVLGEEINYQSPGKSLTVRYSNLGEPYRDGVEVYITYSLNQEAGVFLVHRDASHLWDVLGAALEQG